MENEQSIAIYPMPQGICLEIRNGEDKEQVILSSDDAAKMATSLLTNSIIYQLNEQMRQTVKQQEFEKMRKLIEDGANVDLSKLKNA